MIRRLVILSLLVCNIAAAQDTNTATDTIRRFSTHATLFGLGAAYQQDTYLSPLQYEGSQFSVIHEGLRRTHILGGKVFSQSLVQLNVSKSSSPALNADFIGGQVHYDHAWLYDWALGRRWHLMAGPEVGGTLGVLYNTRNGNNPAQALANIRLSASAGAIFRFHLWRRDFALRYHMDFALLGAMFSPAYGQSYYELFSLGHRDHNIRLTHPFNGRRFRNQLTLDIPCKRNTLRVGYFIDVQESHVNDIRHSDAAMGIVIGWVRHLNRKKSNRTVPDGFIL